MAVYWCYIAVDGHAVVPRYGKHHKHRRHMSRIQAESRSVFRLCNSLHSQLFVWKDLEIKSPGQYISIIQGITKNKNRQFVTSEILAKRWSPCVFQVSFLTCAILTQSLDLAPISLINYWAFSTVHPTGTLRLTGRETSPSFVPQPLACLSPLDFPDVCP